MVGIGLFKGVRCDSTDCGVSSINPLTRLKACSWLSADMPGCRAWGVTQEEAYRNLESVAEFIASYQEHGDELPQGVDVCLNS